MIVPCENCDLDLRLQDGMIVLEPRNKPSHGPARLTLDQALALTQALHNLTNEAMLEHAHEMGKLDLNRWLDWARGVPINLEEWAERNKVRLFDPLEERTDLGNLMHEEAERFGHKE